MNQTQNIPSYFTNQAEFDGAMKAMVRKGDFAGALEAVAAARANGLDVRPQSERVA